VREGVKAYVARSDNADAVGERWRTLPPGELLVLVGEVTAPGQPYSNRSSSSANRQVSLFLLIIASIDNYFGNSSQSQFCSLSFIYLLIHCCLADGIELESGELSS